jgi:serine/threonine protein kinase
MTPANARPQAPPDLPAHLELLRLIGAGASGSVYLARDRRLGRTVALKLMPLEPGEETLAETQRRFAAEVATSSRLQHPDIIATLDAGCAGTLAWLVMELVPGTALSRYTQPRRLLPELLVLEIVRRMALALGHAHAQEVVHRDVKPSNVIVHWPDRLVKLGDFGLARGADTGATRTGMMLGSPAYMAPELLAGARPSVSTDLYALGVTLYELLAGRLPFGSGTGGGLGDLLRQVAREPAPDLGLLRPDVAAALPGLPRLVASLLAKDRADRPLQAADVATQLQALMAAAAAPGVAPH